MKKHIIFLSLLTLCISCTVSRHTGTYKPFKEFSKDTTAYLREDFVNRKNEYIGKKFKVLLNDLEIKVKSSDISEEHPYRIIGTSISFKNRDETMLRIELNLPITLLDVNFKKEMFDKSIIELTRKTKGNWSRRYRKLYGNQIVNDVSICVFPFPKRNVRKK